MSAEKKDDSLLQCSYEVISPRKALCQESSLCLTCVP